MEDNDDRKQVETLLSNANYEEALQIVMISLMRKLKAAATGELRISSSSVMGDNMVEPASPTTIKPLAFPITAVGSPAVEPLPWAVGTPSPPVDAADENQG